jgi:hypothetical protein
LGEDLWTANQKWRNDPSEWRISNTDKSYTLRSNLRANSDEWILSTEKEEAFIYTEYEFDLRDWIVESETLDVYSNEIILALSFAVIQTIMLN